MATEERITINDKTPTPTYFSSDDNRFPDVPSLNYIAFLTSQTCDTYRDTEHWLFQVANAIFLLSYAVPSTKYCTAFMHSLLILGLRIISCRCHSIGKVTRLQFKKLVSEPFAQVISLYSGEAYAMQNITRTDRLSLLLSGKVNAMQDHQVLHPIFPGEFFDSPEFESRINEDDKFKVSIIAAVPCRYLYWQRSSLEYLFVKETHLATVVATLVAADITKKLYAMNNKIVTDDGTHLDIRLPSITGTHGKPGVKYIRKQSNIQSAVCLSPPDSDSSSCRGRLVNSTKNIPALNEMLADSDPMTGFTSSEDFASAASGAESWVDGGSNYYSCELLDE